jgi:hypothetical protein
MRGGTSAEVPTAQWPLELAKRDRVHRQENGWLYWQPFSPARELKRFSMHSYAVQPISPSSSLIGAFFLPA